jgi:hypothetical protein
MMKIVFIWIYKCWHMLMPIAGGRFFEQAGRIENGGKA